MSGLLELERLLPGAVVSGRDVLASYRRDSASWAPAREPVALVRQQNTEQVRELARWAGRHRVPIVPRGAGIDVDGILGPNTIRALQTALQAALQTPSQAAQNLAGGVA